MKTDTQQVQTETFDWSDSSSESLNSLYYRVGCKCLESRMGIRRPDFQNMIDRNVCLKTIDFGTINDDDQSDRLGELTFRDLFRNDI